MSSADDSESRPNGFSTITRVHPFVEDAAQLEERAESTKMSGGIER